MAGSIEGVLLKIERARRHLDAINEALDAFIKTAFDETVAYCEVDTRYHALKLTKIRRPERALALTVGDFLHNVRSALDHLAYQLVMWPTSPGGKKAAEDKIMFPLCSCRDAFEGSKWKLAGAAPGVEAIIERLQSYNTGQPYFWLLQELNNWDKHRLLHLTENTLLHVGFLNAERVAASEVRPEGELEDDAVLGRWLPVSRPEPQVDVGLYFGTEVTFEDGPGAGWQVRGVLTSMLIFTEDALRELAPFIDHGAAPDPVY